MRRECTVAELLDHGAMERQALAKLMCRYRKRLVISITTSENAERRSVVLKAKRDCIPTLMERVYALHANRGEWESHLDHEEGETALPDLDSLELAEGYLQAAKQETENSTARELCAKAHDWLDATMDSVAYWERSGVDIPADVRARIDNIKSHFNR